jgi:hypothetical protein
MSPAFAPQLTRRALLALALLLLALSSGVGHRAGRAEEAAAGSALGLVLDGLRSREAAITSVSLRYTWEKQENDDPAVLAYRDPDEPPLVPRRLWTGSFAFDRARFYQDRRLVEPTGQNQWQFSAFDGARGRLYITPDFRYAFEVLPDKLDTVALYTDMGIWLGLAHHFKPDEPTHSQRLLSAGARVVTDSARIGDLRCYLLEATRRDGTERWWIAPDRDWIVVKHEHSRGRWDDTILAGRTATTVDDFVTVNDFWMPAAFTRQSQSTYADGKTRWFARNNLRFTYESLNRPLPVETFQRAFPAGTLVLGVLGSYVVGE